jgi:probable HAF family extracellular repeat protein
MGWSAAFAINDANQVAGYGEIAPGVFRGFTWQGGGATQLGTFGGASSYAFGINGSGSVAGHAQTASGATHAFLYDGAMRDLGTLGGSSSYAYDVNAAGWVVGHSWLAGGGQTHAFLFTGDGLLDLNLLLRNAAEWELLEAYGINDAGQIVGAGLYNGQKTAFRLDMLSSDTAIVHNPEPGTIGLMACGLGLIALGLWRRDRRS